MMLLLPMAFTSCSNEDDLPDVDFDVTFSGAEISDDDVLYVVQGESFAVDAISVVAKESSIDAVITGATYYWDGYPLGSNAVSPYGFEINTSSNTPLGNHRLSISCPVFEVNKAGATAVVTFDVVVVAPGAGDEPADQSGSGRTSLLVTPDLEKY